MADEELTTEEWQRVAGAHGLSEYRRGRQDRLDGKGCLSANGRYLEGWYSIPKEDAPPILDDGPEPVRPTLTVTTTFTEEESNGWAYIQDDRSVGIYGGWSHDHPSHEDEWPEIEETGWGRCGEPTPNGAIGSWERHECTACHAVLVVLKANQLDMDGDLLW